MIPWRLRTKLFVERFWQPTSACMACMPGSLGNLWSAAHWATALQTGLGTGLLALLLSFTPVARLYGNRFANALVVGSLTALGDGWSHPNHYGFLHAEALLTGAVSALLSLVSSYLLEDRARRLRAAWARLVGKEPVQSSETLVSSGVSAVVRRDADGAGSASRSSLPNVPK